MGILFWNSEKLLKKVAMSYNTEQLQFSQHADTIHIIRLKKKDNTVVKGALWWTALQANILEHTLCFVFAFYLNANWQILITLQQDQILIKFFDNIQK